MNKLSEEITKVDEAIVHAEAPIEQITEALLEIGGTRVVIRPEGEWIDEIAKGTLSDHNTVKWLKGKRSRCHTNAAGGYLLRFPDLRIATGFALLEKTCWVRHSWLSGIGVIYETSYKFDLYWGIVLEHGTKATLMFLAEEFNSVCDMGIMTASRP